ncbi:MAG: hypothetical protein Q8K71_15540 [Polaromonas sp.]|jgi:hypothetical protein|nr:hypothetical protein [Hylemonella sp.]MDP1955886.1 hypothetical protein [Polaromonas sp.]
MAETVNVSSSPGANYTWTSGKFAWSSATAGKNWTTAYPAVYALSVATDLSFAELVQKLGIKRNSESMTFSDKSSRALALNKYENLNFVETYTDLIAFVLRFVESLTFTEKYARTGTKAVFEAFQVGEGLARQLVLRKYETLALAETYTDLIAFILRVSESLSFSEKPSKGMTKPQAENFRLSDALVKSQVKQISEAFSLAEALGRTVAYRRAINEGFAIGEAIRRAQTLKLSEAFSLAEQYRRRANGVISDMIVANTEITEQDFMDILESGHPPGYTNFRDFIQGDYTYQRALFRAILTSSNADRGYIDGLRVTVDVPDVFDRGTAQVVTASSGVTVIFVRTFRVSPEVTLTFKGGTTVAIPRILGTVTTAGFTAVLENTSGARVTGAISWIAQGY